MMTMKMTNIYYISYVFIIKTSEVAYKKTIFRSLTGFKLIKLNLDSHFHFKPMQYWKISVS